MSEDEAFLQQIRHEFIQEANELLDRCEEASLCLDDQRQSSEYLGQIFRAVHTIKGSGAAVGYLELVDLTHQFEDFLAALRSHPERMNFEMTSLLLLNLDVLRSNIHALQSGKEVEKNHDQLQQLKKATIMIMQEPATQKSPCAGFGFFDEVDEPANKEALEILTKADEVHHKDEPSSTGIIRRETPSVKIDAGRVDAVLDLIGELVVIKSQLINQTVPYAGDVSLSAVVNLLDKTVRELQDKALSIRLMPIKPMFLKIQRLVRDLMIKVGKNVEFEVKGEETEIDRMVVEALSEPLIHILRNALDHGIEPESERIARGKSPVGHLSMTAAQLGSRIIVHIRDDGRGICREKVLKKAKEQNLLAPDIDVRNLTDQFIHELLLTPGFSTAETVTDLSGRGVGLDVVRTQVDKLRGELTITSIEGQGTCFEISLPLSASVTDGMLVKIGEQKLVIPMDRIQELVEIVDHDIIEMSRSLNVLKVRDKNLPLIDSRSILRSGPYDVNQNFPMAVVLNHKDQLYAFRIEAVIGQMQVVVKPMDRSLRCDAITGATILGDGSAALIADIDGLVKLFLKKNELKLAA